MKKGLSYAVLAVTVLATGGLACRRADSSASSDANTYHLVCKHCNHVWVIERDQARTYPADPEGAGFKCEKCGKFGARIGTQCKQCKNWYIAESRGMPCPICAKDNAARNAPPGDRS